MEYNAQDLIRMGYRRTSSKYKVISRIDRWDWVDFIYDTVFIYRKPYIKDAVNAYYEGMALTDFGFTKIIVEREARSAADYYRRCYSVDKIEGVPDHVFKQIPGSGDDLIGYCKGNKFKKGDTIK